MHVRAVGHMALKRTGYRVQLGRCHALCERAFTGHMGTKPDEDVSFYLPSFIFLISAIKLYIISGNHLETQGEGGFQ